MPDSYKLLQESQLFVQEAVKQLNEEKLDFIIFGGDQVEGVGQDLGNWQFFLDSAQELNAPWSFILGECDISGVSPIDKVKTFRPDWRARGIDTQTPYWSHSPLPAVHIVGLDTSSFNSVKGDVEAEQLQWLKDDLQANKDKFTIIFSHHPLLPPAPYGQGLPLDQFLLPQAEAIRAILEAHPQVALSVNGHVHVNSQTKANNIWYVSSSSVDVFPCAYKIFHVRADEVSLESKPINFPALVKKARKELVDSAFVSQGKVDGEIFAKLAEGKHESNNASLAFYGEANSPVDKPHGKQAKVKG
jgi:3',5'-cyclic AMP phosphodiesterase CpdA